MPIGRDLRAKRFFITGATGFLGTALVERILRCIPDAEITVLVRPGRRADAAARLAREVIRNDCFNRLRDELGDRFAAEVARRVKAVPGDVGQDGLGLDDAGRAALAASDIVIHSAATVSFDAPLTQAVEINLLGPARVGAAVAASGSGAHLISVSTAYVASTHQGEAKEELLSENRFTLDIDWEDEVKAARRLRDDLQAASRRPDRLAGFTKDARNEIGGAGDHLLAARAEKIREEWVRTELVDAGTARAHSLGWPDAYPFTKAMGERVLVQQWAGTVPITFVRPSIIESALEEPRPGWIRGFRMAEPIIISYARGMLREFPGVPEGIVDVIPVDLVVAAILGVAAHGPDPDGPTVYHVASGVRNPFPYGHLVELCEDWFSRNPLYDERGQPISVPEWSFPGRGRVQRQLRRADQAMTVAERLLTSLPVRGKQAELAARIEDRHALAKRALGYVELYGAYAETDARYRVDRLLVVVGHLRRGRPPDVLLRSRRHRLGPLRAQRAPPFGGRARPGPHHLGPLGGREAPGAGPPGHPVGRPSSGRVRPRAHPDGLERGRHLRLAGQPPPPPGTAGQVRRRSLAPGPVPAGAGPPRPGRLPALVLPALRGRSHRPVAARLVGALPHAAPDPLVPRGLRPGPGPPRPRSSHPAHHRRAGLHHCAGDGPSSTTSSAPRWKSATAS